MMQNTRKSAIYSLNRLFYIVWCGKTAKMCCARKASAMMHIATLGHAFGSFKRCDRIWTFKRNFCICNAIAEFRADAPARGPLHFRNVAKVLKLLHFC